MFGRKLSSDQDDNVEINLSPMIDCIFILLIFFIVTTVFVEETGLKVNKPDLSTAPLQLEKNSILIAVSSDDKVVYAKKTIGVQGVAAMLKPLLTADPDLPVIIQGDQAASHGVVQRVHAEAIIAGARKQNISISAKN